MLGPLLRGPAFLALRARVPIVPVGIGGSARSMPIGAKWVLPVRISIVIGKPIWPPPATGSERVPRRVVEELTERLREECRSFSTRPGRWPETEAPPGQGAEDATEQPTQPTQRGGEARMEYRQLGRSGLRVSSMALGTMTFGGAGSFSRVGTTDVDEARRIVDRCCEAGVNLIDTADVYSGGRSEEIVGQVVRGRRDDLLIATKCRFPTEDGPNGAGS